MSADAIYIVTNAIKARLQSAIDEAASAGELFVGPLDESDAASAPLVLYLYRINLSEALRNDEHRMPGDLPGNPWIFDRALPLELHYIVSTGRHLTSQDEAMRNLGYAIRKLNDMPVLTNILLGPDPARLTFVQANSEEMSRVWALFPTVNYRTSVLYAVSPVWIDPLNARLSAPGVVGQDLAANHLA
jgi:hypothetical protein